MRIYLAMLVLVGSVAVAVESVAAEKTGVPPTDQSVAPKSTTTTEPVVVEAPEPRYVAPTFRDRIGRIWAPVLINGKGPYRLVLDTGANSSAIIESVAKSLDIPIEHSQNVRLHGVTGSAVVPTITVDSLEVGELLIDKTILPIVADVFGGAEGVLGSKGLADKRIFIDFHHDKIEIARSHSQSPPAGFSNVPVKLTRGQLLTFDLTIGGVKTKAILDTGAQQTIGNNSLRVALMRRIKEGRSQEIIGITLDVAHGQSIATPPVSMGGVEIRNMRITFGDMFIFEQWKLMHEPALLIGMDVIGSLDTLIIDYKLRELQFRARR